jgi:hypothetical protein
VHPVWAIRVSCSRSEFPHFHVFDFLLRVRLPPLVLLCTISFSHCACHQPLSYFRFPRLAFVVGHIRVHLPATSWFLQQKLRPRILLPVWSFSRSAPGSRFTGFLCAHGSGKGISFPASEVSVFWCRLPRKTSSYRCFLVVLLLPVCSMFSVLVKLLDPAAWSARFVSMQCFVW